MFTGLVQALGVVEQVTDARDGRRLRIAEPTVAPQLTVGESVAVNGACLTVVARTSATFDLDVGPETLAKTVLGQLQVGDRVNLERALRVGDALGGHFVTGHVDCVGTIHAATVTGDWLTMVFGFPPRYGELLVPKGSIAVDGVSLTVVDVEDNRFSVMLIPHTRDHTTLGFKPPGATVNLEFDLLAKHIQKLFNARSRNRAD
ncbi:MAG: riboflavin synthase [Gemmataceae bacterium]|nr:riboflavin synthase [Gemmata sp.]MDW8197643.1 riboflavin synthase [Gemmataceae bacterium]